MKKILIYIVKVFKNILYKKKKPRVIIKDMNNFKTNIFKTVIEEGVTPPEYFAVYVSDPHDGITDMCDIVDYPNLRYMGAIDGFPQEGILYYDQELTSPVTGLGKWYKFTGILDDYRIFRINDNGVAIDTMACSNVPVGFEMTISGSTGSGADACGLSGTTEIYYASSNSHPLTIGSILYINANLSETTSFVTEEWHYLPGFNLSYKVDANIADSNENGELLDFHNC